MRFNLFSLILIFSIYACNKEEDTILLGNNNFHRDQLFYAANSENSIYNFNIYTRYLDEETNIQLTNFINQNFSVFVEDLDYSPVLDKLVFTSNFLNSGQTEIYTMDVDGSNITQLTSNGIKEQGPTWSNDGSKILYTAKSENNPNYDIFTIDSDGTNQRPLTNFTISPSQIVLGNACWSPDNAHIIFTYKVDSEEIKIASLSIDSLKIAEVSGDNGLNEQNVKYSPDGQKILFEAIATSNSNIYNLYTLNADGSNLINLTNYTTSSRFLYTGGASWSKDGSKIAFITNNNSDVYDLFIMDSDGSNVSKLTNDVATQDHTTWK